MDGWYDALRERFSMPVTEARNLYNSLEYTLYDVYEKCDPDEFLQKVVVYGQEAREATTEQAQAQAAYNKLSAILQVTLTPPTDTTTITEFARQVNARKSQWFACYKRGKVSSTTRSGRRADRRTTNRGERRSNRTPFSSSDGNKGRSSGTKDKPRYDSYRPKDADRTDPLRKNDYPPDERDNRNRRSDRRSDRDRDRDGRARAYHAQEDSEGGDENQDYTSTDNYDSRDDDAQSDCSEAPAYAAQVVHSAAPAASGTGRDYRLWHTVTLKTRLDLNREPITVVYGTGCGMTLIDRRIVADEIKNPEIKTLPAAVMVKGIGSRRHASS